MVPEREAIAGATDSIYHATLEGSYTARFSNPCDFGPESKEAIIGQNRQAQTISFQSLADRYFGDTAFALSASASSRLPVTFKVVSGPVTVINNIVTINGAGMVTIQAEQQGNSQYAAASVSKMFTVFKSDQTVSFDAIADTLHGLSYGLIASASSGLPVFFTASVNGKITDNKLTFVGAGPGDRAGDPARQRELQRRLY